MFPVYDILVIGFCLAARGNVVGVSYFPDDDEFSTFGVIYYHYDPVRDKFYFAVCDCCNDTPETRKNAVFKYCSGLTDFYHSIPVFCRDIFFDNEQGASICSISEFNIDIDSM